MYRLVVAKGVVYVEKVSEEEYTHCFLQNPHLVGSCNNNTQEVSITVVFRQFTPTPGGMEFEPGRTYYFITTSDGTLSGIDRRKDGLCTERQMKVKFEVQLPKHELQHHVNPKFAARTSQKEQQEEPEASTPIMYIIHVDGENSDELDDDVATTAFMPLPLLLSLLLFYLN
ncbi:Ephrin [Ancylostoma duodenale]|uniref:Ephrin n=1 Tax=Ancylostoma duodenale TaxID=51022 RepID=A0A0C2GI31_9BILA|nr:Ephrin [Ancylostoma duodenale]